MLSEIDSFVKWERRRNPDARTWRDYSYDLKEFVAVVGDWPPASVTFYDVDRFVNHEVSRGLGPATINRRLATITSFYTFLADDNPTLVRPVLPRRHGLKEPQRLPRPVQVEDLSAFFATIHHSRDRAMFVLMLRCGLRISEVADLKLSDLYLDESNSRIIAHGKGSKERSVYLSSQAERSLRTYLAERPATTSDFVFLSYLRDGLSTTAIHKRLMRYRFLAGVHLTAHRLRQLLRQRPVVRRRACDDHTEAPGACLAGDDPDLRRRQRSPGAARLLCRQPEAGGLEMTTAIIESAAIRYDAGLRKAHHSRLPPGYIVPQPTRAWPIENVALLERYQEWLLGGGTNESAVNRTYIPMVGHALGLNLNPHHQLDTDADLEKAFDYIKAKRLGAEWTDLCRLAIEKFRFFLRQERGQSKIVSRPANPRQFCADLPDWLVEQMERYQHLRQRNWRQSRLSLFST